MIRVFIFVMLLPFAAKAETVIDAIPNSRVVATPDAAQRDILSASRQQENRLIIVKNQGNYYWATRESTPLVYNKSGIFHLFIDPKGGGYVEIADTHAQPESLRPKGARFKYKEHLRSGMFGAFTYFGEVDKFTP